MGFALAPAPRVRGEDIVRRAVRALAAARAGDRGTGSRRRRGVVSLPCAPWTIHVVAATSMRSPPAPEFFQAGPRTGSHAGARRCTAPSTRSSAAAARPRSSRSPWAGAGCRRTASSTSSTSRGSARGPRPDRFADARASGRARPTLVCRRVGPGGSKTVFFPSDAPGTRPSSPRSGWIPDCSVPFAASRSSSAPGVVSPSEYPRPRPAAAPRSAPRRPCKCISKAP